MRKVFLIAGLSLALAACGGHVGIASPGDEYLTCSGEAEVPAGDPVTGAVSDEQDAYYKRDLRAAWANCHSKVEYLRDWFSKLPKPRR